MRHFLHFSKNNKSSSSDTPEFQRNRALILFRGVPRSVAVQER